MCLSGPPSHPGLSSPFPIETVAFPLPLPTPSCFSLSTDMSLFPEMLSQLCHFQSEVKISHWLHSFILQTESQTRQKLRFGGHLLRRPSQPHQPPSCTQYSSSDISCGLRPGIRCLAIALLSAARTIIEQFGLFPSLVKM